MTVWVLLGIFLTLVFVATVILYALRDDRFGDRDLDDDDENDRRDGRFDDD